MQEYTNNNKIKENKYKILRMSLLLGSDEEREETLNNFEDAACEIDAMNDEIYLKDLENKFYETNTLEEEEKKLAVLVDYIGGRVEQRISLLTDFANVTGFDLQTLPPIKYYDKLDDYKERLKYIREYLDNTKQLEILKQEVTDAEEKLKTAYKNKETSEEYNIRNEDLLLNKFQNISKTLDYFKPINEQTVEEELNKVTSLVDESQKSLNIFTKSYTTLIHSGITQDEENEYHSYVVNARELYYENKEKEYIIRLYQLLIQKEKEYGAILQKRDSINNLLYERLTLRKELEINTNDCLLNMYDILEKQYEDIKRQKDNIELIDDLTETIATKKEEINNLEIDNQKVEILALLREYGIIETYTEEAPEEKEILPELSSEQKEDLFTNTQQNIDNVNSLGEISFDNVKEEQIENNTTSDIPVENNIIDSPFKQEINFDNNNNNIEIKDNQIIKVEEAINIDLDLVHAKANKVMQRVGEMLGIKPKEEQIVSVETKREEPVIEEVKQEEPILEPVKENVDNNEQVTSPLPMDNEIDNNFWFPSDTPDALNELPDLELPKTEENSNNFFTTNMPEMNFPDLKIDFGANSNNGEEK